MHLIVYSETSRDACKLRKLYANWSRSQITHLKERLTLISCDTKPAAEYLQTLKGLIDELALVDTPLDSDDLIIHVFNRIGPEFKEIVVVVRLRMMEERESKFRKSVIFRIVREVGSILPLSSA
ncbi:hypothetical protein Ddye_004505 [Dipteronia dyeriana]|uniref:Uncharacterized protein n=1 Tax=Dipteronia dyeriana TaxID=168575 RepID=A0AAD9XUZ7_9ROSI|nr:hypothetical protein Ddye_004505 [Dipteronia dyeriana]